MGILLGPRASIPDWIRCDAFLDYVSATEREVFKDALGGSCSAFSPEVQEKLLSTLSRFGCPQMPTPSNQLMACLLQVARFEFCSKPAAAISLMHSGVPLCHTGFWRERAVEGLSSIYKALAVSSRKVLDIIKLPESLNVADTESVYLAILIITC